MKSNPFADQAPAGGGGGSQQRNRKDSNKPKEKEVSMEEKLAMLVSKFKK